MSFYADRKDELNDAIGLIFNPKLKIIVYKTCPSYGITAFFHRVQWTLKSTNDILCFYSELSETTRSPIHKIMKDISIKKGELYQSLQLYTDENYGEYEESLSKNIVKDLPALGETLSCIFDEKKAMPIYSGFYSDIIKEGFFYIVNYLSTQKRIYFFVDNIQFIDNDSIYDMIALSKMINITFVFSVQGEITGNAEKLLLELGAQNRIIERSFGIPSTICIKELGEKFSKNISDCYAKELQIKTQGNIRKIIYNINNSSYIDLSKTKFKAEISSILLILNDEINETELYEIITTLPFSTLISYSEYEKTLDLLENDELLTHTYSVNKSKKYKIRYTKENADYWENLINNPADSLVYHSAVYNFLNSKQNLTHDEVLKLFEISQKYSFSHKDKWTIKATVSLLHRGLTISETLMQELQDLKSIEGQFLYAICLIKKLKYRDAKILLSNLSTNYNEERNIKKLYAFTLNRCREHSEAEKLLKMLLKSCKDIDEKALLLSLLVINNIHFGKEKKAKEVFLQNINCSKLTKSKYFAYFLRNSATLFPYRKALLYWEAALNIFKENQDFYGEHTTICNMARCFIFNDPQKANKMLQESYDFLLKYGLEQIHIVSNNLGISYLYCDDTFSAAKYLKLSIFIAKSIMPKTYATINYCGLLISQGRSDEAFDEMMILKDEVESSNLNRLKAKFYLSLSSIFYIKKDYANALQYLNETDKLTNKFGVIRRNLRNKIEKQTPFDTNEWKEIFSPCFLEYWIIEPLALLSEDYLSF